MQSPLSLSTAAASSSARIDTPVVRALKVAFRWLGARIARHPAVWLSISTLITCICAARIPLTPLSNDVSDFTPTGARARHELARYKSFFANSGNPIVVYVFITEKHGGNMLGVRQLEEAVRVSGAGSCFFIFLLRPQNSFFLRNCKFLKTILAFIR